MRKSIVIVISLLALLGCNSDSGHRDKPSVDHYQIAISSDGKVYRLDKTTGEIVVIENGILKRIAEPGQITIDLNAIDAEIARRKGKEVGTVPKRLPGESIPDYLKRTGQQ
jgi:hypothetical protein